MYKEPLISVRKVADRMGGTSSRNKGQRGEREVIALLQPIVDTVCRDAGVAPVELQRNLLQAHKGGCDLHGLDWLSLEVKRCEAQSIGAWWSQTLRQARPNQTPVLIFRANHQPWMVRMRCRLRTNTKAMSATVNVDLPTFLFYFKLRMREEVR